MEEITLRNELTDFSPPFWMRPAMAQTILASRKFRKKAAQAVIDGSESHIFECGDGIRLKGSYTPSPQAKGLFIYLHGWEGSEISTYVLSSSRFIYEQDYSIFRLNFRDHGDTHHLNEGLFHSGMFDEILQGVKQAANLTPDIPVYIVGFSLGGNFALRIARVQNVDPIENLQHIFAISPVIDPVNSSDVVDQNRLIQKYFLKKWSTSLQKKQAAFPHLYDFSESLSQSNVTDMTELFLSKYSEFTSAHEYFSSYAIHPDDLKASSVRISMVMSSDDPVIEPNDMMALNISSCVTRIMLKYGGHNGFFQSLFGPTWYDDYISRTLKAEHS